MNISTENTTIYNLLEKANQLFPDFNTDHVTTFDLEDNFYTILYISTTRNFILFAAENHLQHPGELPALLQTVQDYPDLPHQLRNAAVKLIEHRMYSKNNSRFFFDAH